MDSTFEFYWCFCPRPCLPWTTTNTHRNHCFTSNNTVVQLYLQPTLPTFRTFPWNCFDFATFTMIISPNKPRSSPVNAMAGQQLCQVNGSCKDSTSSFRSMTGDFRLISLFFNMCMLRYTNISLSHIKCLIFWIYAGSTHFFLWLNKIVSLMSLFSVSNHQNLAL